MTALHKNTIREWPCEDRPREKLLRCGEHALGNSELLAILLRTGNRDASALDLARQILERFTTFREMSHTDPSHWRGIKGLGPAKIAQIKAALEIGRRFRENEAALKRPKVHSSRDVVDILMPRMRDLKKEVFKVILLNSQNRIIEISSVTEGTVNQANPIIREIFQIAMQQFAAAVIAVHNHPSGVAAPSPEDKNFTRELVAAGKVLNIPVLDHLIIGNNIHYSFSDAGLIG